MHIQGGLLWVDQCHCIFQIQVAFAVVVETHHVLLDYTAIDRVQDGTISNLPRGEVAEEQIQIRGNVGLWCIFHNTIAVLRVLGESRRELVQCSQAVGRDLLVTIAQLLDDIALCDGNELGNVSTAGTTRVDVIIDSTLLRVGISWLDLEIEVECWGDEIDFVLQRCGDAVLLASYMRLTSFLVFVDVIFGLEKALCFIHSSIKVQPSKTLRLVDAFA